ncbi:hypothetical protein AVEN_171917-1 [Araneus ventricosus]|uniref:DDE-1 domain-containing protein n=1 Tax=Araneus ventricosus TaxID=182803 RepID=A0A4Y2V433_ARAVE|nr:hypothetical protein AVEN_171917-1 [Araneus ventricosus]
MDQGVIQNFKIYYRKKIVRKVITALENNQSMPKIILRESISEISKEWNYDIADRTTRNSFAKAGFFVSNEGRGGKVSALGSEGSRLDSTEYPPCMGPVVR